MKIVKLNESELENIQMLYKDIKEKTFTLWDDDYPSKDLILWDIEREGLFGVKDGERLVAITFFGERQEDGEDDFTWKYSFTKRGTFARIGVAPDYQNCGVGTMLVEYVLNNLKKQGFDGVRILVGIDNKNAIKLYTKFGFENSGTIARFGHKYYLFELKLK